MPVEAQHGDFIAVGKTKRGNFLAVHIPANIQLEQDDCATFLFKEAWFDHDDNDMAYVAARRLMSDMNKALGCYFLEVEQNSMLWDRGWRIYRIKYAV